ncbi:MAG TPA: hypothetical protein VLE22_20280 [Bryobacteraceae bacterium]|nr:hypothetical protein [Bryobacteraceae bacterium]
MPTPAIPRILDPGQKVAEAWKSMKLTLDKDLQATRNGNIAWTTYPEHLT